MSSVVTVSALVEAVRQADLVDAKRLEELERRAAEVADADRLSRECVRQGWLTRYQADHLLAGHAAELRVGPYAILDRVGEGATGFVFRARHTVMRREVALKVVRPELLLKPRLVERFYREVHALARLKHPNIVEAYDAGQAGKTHYFAMEFVHGVDLYHLVKQKGPLPVGRACRYIRQAALGLHHAFELGMVHRDVKPGNLVVTFKDGAVKVLDMGLVSMRGQTGTATLTEAGSFIGTPDFMAPEQADDARQVDIRADVYSLGASLYFLLAGQTPFPEGTIYKKLLWIQVREPEAIEARSSGLPPGLPELVRQLMAKAPDGRPATPADVARLLEPFADLDAGDDVPPVAEFDGPAAGSKSTEVGGLFTPGLATAAPAPPPPKTVQAPGHPTGRPPVRLRDRPWFAPAAAGVIGLGTFAVVLLGLHAAGPAPSSIAAPTAALPKGEGGWAAAVGKLPPAERLAAVVERLAERNRGFDGDVQPERGPAGEIIGLTFSADSVEDLSPLAVLRDLRQLTMNARPGSSCPLRDLSPLTGLPLTVLRCRHTQVADLSPLKNAPLQALDVSYTQVTDLALVRPMPLEELRCAGTRVNSLAPLRGKVGLKVLEISGAPIASLAPLDGAELTFVSCDEAPVADLSPLRAAPLVELRIVSTPVTDLSPLSGVTTLQRLSVGGCRVADLSPLRELTALHSVDCHNTPVADLSPLANLPLTELDCHLTRVADLRPLERMALKVLRCHNTRVADLAPLKRMRLELVTVQRSAVQTLGPLQGMPLREIGIDKPSAADEAWLRKAPTLQTINGVNAGLYWKQLHPPAGAGI